MKSVFVSILCLASLAFGADLEALLKDARAYHDGKLAKIEDMVLEYTGTFMGPGGEGAGMKSTLTRKGEKWRMEATMNMGGGKMTMNGEEVDAGGGMETTVLFDGKDMWTSTMGMKMKMPQDKAMEQMSFTQYWNEPPAGSSLTGEESVNGRNCYVVIYPENDVTEAPSKMWIDKEWYVNVRSESHLSGKVIKTDFSDFKAVSDGYMIPHKAVVYSGDQKTMDVTITKVEVNQGVEESLFDAASLGGSAMDMDIEKLMKQAEEMQKQYGK